MVETNTEATTTAAARVLHTAQSAARTATRVQRRIWLVQAAFWPVVILTAATATTAGVLVYRRRRRSARPNLAVVPAEPPTG